ncbi:MAG: rRNA (cytidine1920-2-O)/16S rRNA (cytidine1409-2-O)-methyltransferase [Fusobacteriaceae bacterium]|nr:rRNA (cytidine1920-2-O)/16S rRNA (cytidine1409-2-O)-methyltransferase [Fusobacteriaceae bacterium]
MIKERLDILLVKNGFFDSREKAKRAIMAGIILVNNQKIDKAGTIIKYNEDKEPEIRIKGDVCPYVSRGGYKLEKAIKEFNIDFKDKIVLDIGSSTGGFTDCSLQNGAKYVYAVDVGTNQLAWKLRDDKRVKSIENMHIKHLTLNDIDNEKVDIMVMDVSFISITKIIPDLNKFIKKSGILMALIKPQFEVGAENIEKGGIVRDISKHKLAIENVIKIANNTGFYLANIDISPIKGSKGNIEYITKFIYEEKENIDFDINELLEKAKKFKGEKNVK